MKWIWLFLLAIPISSANCDLSITITSQKDLSFTLKFDPTSQPIEYWLEDAFNTIILPKRITTKQQVQLTIEDIPFQETWYYVKARMLKKCKTSAEVPIKFIKKTSELSKTQTYHAPKKKLFDAIPWLFVGILAILSLTLIWFH